MCEPATLTAIGTWATANAGTIAAVSATAGAGLTAVSAYQQSSVAKAVAQNNAAMAEISAQDAQRRGEKEVQEVQRRAAMLKGAQRSNMAAKGLDLSEGTAAQLQDQTDFFAAADVATTRTNARRDAQGYRSQGANYRAEASGYRPGLSATTSLLSSVGPVADRWMRYSGRG
jgi:hypothetical protein